LIVIAPVRSGEPKEGSMTASDAVPRLDGIRVLVVEDVSSIRELVVETLTQHGAQVTAVDSAVDGLDLLQREAPDALLTSISMPGEDGLWLIRQVRSLPPERGCATPAAAFTGRSTARDRRDILRAGFQFHVAKPVALRRLVWVVALLAGEKGRSRGTELPPRA
jgi:CheY-like chemotaxis protein